MDSSMAHYWSTSLKQQIAKNSCGNEKWSAWHVVVTELAHIPCTHATMNSGKSNEHTKVDMPSFLVSPALANSRAEDIHTYHSWCSMMQCSQARLGAIRSLRVGPSLQI